MKALIPGRGLAGRVPLVQGIYFRNGSSLRDCPSLAEELPALIAVSATKTTNGHQCCLHLLLCWHTLDAALHQFLERDTRCVHCTARRAQALVCNSSLQQPFKVQAGLTPTFFNSSPPPPFAPFLATKTCPTFSCRLSLEPSLEGFPFLAVTKIDMTKKAHACRPALDASLLILGINYSALLGVI